MTNFLYSVKVVFFGLKINPQLRHYWFFFTFFTSFSFLKHLTTLQTAFMLKHIITANINVATITISYSFAARNPISITGDLRWSGLGLRTTYSTHHTARSSGFSGWSWKRRDTVLTFFEYFGLFRIFKRLSRMYAVLSLAKSILSAMPNCFALPRFWMYKKKAFNYDQSWHLGEKKIITMNWSAWNGSPSIGTPCHEASCVLNNPPMIIPTEFKLERDKSSFMFNPYHEWRTT